MIPSTWPKTQSGLSLASAVLNSADSELEALAGKNKNDGAVARQPAPFLPARNIYSQIQVSIGHRELRWACQRPPCACRTAPPVPQRSGRATYPPWPVDITSKRRAFPRLIKHELARHVQSSGHAQIACHLQRNQLNASGRSCLLAAWGRVHVLGGRDVSILIPRPQ